MLKRIIKKLIVCVVLVGLALLMFDIMAYPECYLTTWRAALENDLREGEPAAVEYYTERYYNNDRDLYGDDFAIIEKGGAK